MAWETLLFCRRRVQLLNGSGVRSESCIESATDQEEASFVERFHSRVSQLGGASEHGSEHGLEAEKDSPLSQDSLREGSTSLLTGSGGSRSRDQRMVSTQVVERLQQQHHQRLNEMAEASARIAQQKDDEMQRLTKHFEAPGPPSCIPAQGASAPGGARMVSHAVHRCRRRRCSRRLRGKRGRSGSCGHRSAPPRCALHRVAALGRARARRRKRSSWRGQSRCGP